MQLHPKRSSCMKFIKNHSITKISTVKMAKVHEQMLSKRTLVNLTFLFCFFPFLKVLPIRAESQPIAGIIGLLLILLYGVRRNVFSITLLWFIFVILGYYLFSVILRPSFLPQITLHTIAYLVPLFVFLSLHDKLNLLSTRLYFAVLALWLSAGIIQFFGAGTFVGRLLNSVLAIFMNMRYFYHPGDVRGVAFFAADHACAARIIILFLATAVFFFLTDRIGKKKLWLVILATVVMMIMNKSGTGGLIFVIFLLGLFFGAIVGAIRCKLFLSLLRVVSCGLVMSGIIVVALALMSKHGYQSRFMEVAKVAYDLVTAKKDTPFYASKLVFVGGVRFPTVYAGYFSLIHQYGLGHGVASWLTGAVAYDDFLRDLRLTSYAQRLKDIKPCSYGAAVAFDMGLPGFVLLLIFLFLFTGVAEKGDCRPFVFGLTWAMLFVSICHILVLDLLTIPTPWLLLAYVRHMSLVQTPNRTGRPAIPDSPRCH